MNKILIYTNPDKDPKLTNTYDIANTLDALGYEILIMVSNPDFEVEHRRYKIITNKEEAIKEDIKLAMCIGGDGTVLGFARDFSNTEISIIGLNLGTLGFLTELSLANYERLFRELKEGKEMYKIEERVGLHVEYEGEETKRIFALNDVVVARGSRSKIIDIEVYINGIYVDVYQCDGMLVSTATGSTGYNLSSGGPILLPQSSDIVLSPICPHSLRARPIVVTKEDIITLKMVSEIEKNTNAPTVTVDGQISFDITTNAYINVKVKNSRVKFFVFDEEIFFRKLREKIR